MPKPLPRPLLPERSPAEEKAVGADFFGRPAVLVARELLGKYLARREGNDVRVFRITETEAYVGPEDLAAHSSRGFTSRTKIMFGPPGRWYVYFTYGMHWMLNVVTGPEGYPAAVLIRGVEGFSGPARVTKHLGINEKLNGVRVTPESGLWIEDRGPLLRGSKIISAPRVGVDYAGPVWAAKPYRFMLRTR